MSDSQTVVVPLIEHWAERRQRQAVSVQAGFALFHSDLVFHVSLKLRDVTGFRVII